MTSGGTKSNGADGVAAAPDRLTHDGGTWGLKVKACGPEDAHERLKALAWARYKGEVGATFPVPSFLGRLLARVLPRR